MLDAQRPVRAAAGDPAHPRPVARRGHARAARAAKTAPRLADLETKEASGATPLTAAEAAARSPSCAARRLGGPLASLLAVFAEQIAVLEEDLEQLYDDQFIETCADWVDPLHRRPDRLPGAARRRAERRKPARRGRAHDRATAGARARFRCSSSSRATSPAGTRARSSSSSSWSMTQYMNHLRPHSLAAPICAAGSRWQRIGSAFDAILAHRRRAAHRERPRPLQHPERRHLPVAPRRLSAQRLAGGAPRRPALAVSSARHRSAALHASRRPRTRSPHLATPLNVPEPIGRRVLDAHLADYYTGSGDVDEEPASLRQFGRKLPADRPAHDAGLRSVRRRRGLGARAADGSYAIDPVLGRIALPPGLPAGTAGARRFPLRLQRRHGRRRIRARRFVRNRRYAAAACARARRPRDDPGRARRARRRRRGRDHRQRPLRGNPWHQRQGGQRVELRAANSHASDAHPRTPRSTLAGGAHSEIRLNGLLDRGPPADARPAAGGNLLARAA